MKAQRYFGAKGTQVHFDARSTAAYGKQCKLFRRRSWGAQSNPHFAAGSIGTAKAWQRYLARPTACSGTDHLSFVWATAR